MNLLRGLMHVLLAASLLAPWIAPANAGVIGTEDAAAHAHSLGERERVKALVARPEIARQLQALGVPPQDAQSRVDAMTDAEVRTLAGRLDAVPAAGAMFSDWQWVMIIIGVIIIALLI
jgi:hypothetical protein